MDVFGPEENEPDPHKSSGANQIIKGRNVIETRKAFTLYLFHQADQDDYFTGTLTLPEQGTLRSDMPKWFLDWGKCVCGEGREFTSPASQPPHGWEYPRLTTCHTTAKVYTYTVYLRRRVYCCGGSPHRCPAPSRPASMTPTPRPWRQTPPAHGRGRARRRLRYWWCGESATQATA